MNRIFPALLLVLWVLWAHMPGLDGVFFFDDFETLGLKAATTTPLSGRPLVQLTFAFNDWLGELDPFGYHVFNIAIHGATTLLVFAFLKRALKRIGAIWPSPFAAAFWCAAAWAAHPLQSEAVTYVTQRTELLMGFCCIATLYAFERATSHAVGSRAAALWFVVSVCACAAGMLSKEVMVAAPVLVLLYDRTFHADSWRALWRARARYYVALALCYGVLAAVAWGARAGTAGYGLGVGVGDYLFAQCELIVHYLRLCFWPTALTVDYGVAQPTTFGEVALPFALLALIATVAIAFAVRRPRAGFWCWWTIVLLAPTSSIVPIVSEVGAERRMYLPLLGVIALTLIATAELARRLGWQGPKAPAAARPPALPRAAILVLLLATLTPLALATRSRERLYADELALWTDATLKRPHNSRAHNNRGEALTLRGRGDEAALAFEAALRLTPKYSDAHFNLGVLRARQGAFSAAAVHFREVTQQNVNDADAFFWRGVVHERLNEPAKAIMAYQRTVHIDETNVDARNNLAWLLATHPGVDDRERSLALKHVMDAFSFLTAGPPAMLIDTHAAALAAQGNFDGARVVLAELIEAARSQAWDASILRDLEHRFALYARDEPFREPVVAPTDGAPAPFQGLLRATLLDEH
ncbi:MAG: tetratricopeptide repeat protein [Planctomycetota bacterium]